MNKLDLPRLGVCTSLAFLLAGFALAQSPAPFVWVDTAVPDTIGVPLGFGDVDGDGSPDLIVGAYGGVPAVLKNDGHGWFSPTTSFVGAAGTPVGAIADFNLDGRADVAFVAAGNSGSVSVFFGSPAGVLVFGYTVPVPYA